MKKCYNRHHRNTKIIRDYYEQWYTNKMDNWEEVDKFWEKYNPSKTEPKQILKYEQTNNKHWNWNYDQNCQQKKIPGPDEFTGEFYLILEKS